MSILQEKHAVGDQHVEVIAAFEQPNNATRRVLLRDAENVLRHFCKVGVFEHQVAKRIVAM
jgi:hypothetical protein